MPYDSNGNFSLVPGTIVADGMNVQPSQHNPPFQDIATGGLSLALVRDGRAPMTGVLNMNGNKITGVASGDQPSDVVTNADIADLGVAIGDGKWSLRDLSPNWLRRDGSLYLRSAYPELADLLPPLPDGMSWSNVAASIPNAVSIVATTSELYVASRGAPGTTEAQIWKSSDGLSFSRISTISGLSPNQISFEDGLFIVTGVMTDGDGATGGLSASTDGIVWSDPVTPGVGNTVFGCAYDGETYVAVGQGGNIASSPDLSSWTARTSGTTNALHDIRYLNGSFVAVGLNGTVVTSIDGATFTVRTPGTSQHLFDVEYYAGLYIVVGGGGVILTSPDLAAWTSRTSGTTNAFNAVRASSAGLLTVGVSGVALISNNGTSWTATTTAVSSALASIAINPNAAHEYYALGGGSFIKGVRTLPTQFRVPVGPEPLYDWIRAL